MLEARSPTVMVAHNDEDTRYLLKFWLEGMGYNVVEAADGRAAFELTLGKCPDLILMSERMPKLGGMETTRLIRRQCGACVFPILLMSSYPTEEARAAAVNAGCDSFVPQPVDFDRLGELLGRLLQGAAGGHRAAKAAPAGNLFS
jgi:CheY-like chemotaxis protein